MSLIVRDLSKKYGEKTVVDHISFQMNGPGVYALLGTNGAGKTTTIRMMLDMLEKDSGEVLWNDKPLSFTTCNIGYLAEERGLYPKYPIIDQLRYFAKLRGVSDEVTEQRIRYWAERLNVEEYIFPGKAATAEGAAGAEGALHHDGPVHRGRAEVCREPPRREGRAGRRRGTHEAHDPAQRRRIGRTHLRSQAPRQRFLRRGTVKRTRASGGGEDDHLIRFRCAQPPSP